MQIVSRARRSRDFGATLHTTFSIIFLLTSFCVDSYIQLVATIHRCKTSMKNGKGRIDPWQPKRKQRKKAARSTKNLQQATVSNKGDAMSVPEVFCGKFS
jgi:hypothetical protein